MADDTNADTGTPDSADGTNGDTGNTGDTGDTGNTGDTGDTGSTGESGKPVIPDSYDLKLPENALLSDTGKVADFAKAQGLTQDQAQAAVEYANTVLSDYKDTVTTQLNDMRETWRQQTESDKDIGGEAFKGNAELARRALDKFASEEFHKLLKESGYGNHPEVVRTFVNIGKAMSEDKFESGNKGGNQSTDVADKLYPNQGAK